MFFCRMNGVYLLWHLFWYTGLAVAGHWSILHGKCASVLFFCGIWFSCFSIDCVFTFFCTICWKTFGLCVSGILDDPFFDTAWQNNWGYFELYWHSEVLFDGGSMVYLLANLFKISVKGLLFYLFVIPIPPFWIASVLLR